MRVGIGLPTMLAGAEPSLVLEWARRADSGGLSTLSTGELLTTASYDALVALSAVAAVTERARLMTNVLVVPLHNAGLLAKQAATLDKISAGRLTIGIGVGGRKPILFELTSDPLAHANYPDFAAAPASYEGRADRCDEQVAYMRQIWRGEPPMEGVPPIGPLPVRAGGPELLCGSFAPAAMRRAARWADGVTNFDLSIFRQFPFSEGKFVELRAEFFNAFNTPVFGTPDSNLSSTRFGIVSGTLSTIPERQIQFGLKIVF